MGIDQTRANQAMNAAAALGTTEAFSENEVIVANHVIPAARVIAKVVRPRMGFNGYGREICGCFIKER